MAANFRALMILGPTASGKTAVSLQLAKRLPIEIISVDSALVYRGMDIGTAKPTKEELASVPHHLIDIVEIEEPYSAADFREDTLRLIDEITARGNFPVIVGGTMLYAKALREGIDALPTTSPEVRDAVQKEAQELGWPAMHEKLREVDPTAAGRLNPNDSQRIGRALEVFRMTGRPLSSFHRGAKEPDPTIATVALLPENRARLHAAIEKRFDAMLASDFLTEMRTLMARAGFSEDLPSMRAVGYRQAIDHLMGRTTFDEFRLAGIAATRQLAKRQITWLRSMPAVTTFDPYEETSEAIVNELVRLIGR
ncbi:MAG: tRNA (adenosine(37)-N6)-dimethylallyltransferase MiaA [Sutterellaceae bacterium]|nr:tRNA (adenosine(37)-N6)-dimethylallyltransferase MiaA [Sutterellaceae bacterium]